MHNEIHYSESIEYGTMRRRIENDNDAVRAFHAVTGRITLTDTDIRNLPKLGVKLVCLNGRVPTVR